MASSKKSPPSNSSYSTVDSYLIKHLEGFLSSLIQPHQKLLAAFSGGLDSRVLLELLVLLKPMLRYELRAMHVHHGLSPHADQWAAFCIETCEALGVPIDIVRINVEKNSGHGIEATARRARYGVLKAAAADFIVLAHHQDDQAETLLLQMLRGAGTKGLAGMAKHDARNQYLRPLLDVYRAQLLEFANRNKLIWIEDESNADIGYDRNFCRHHILPVIEQRFPAAKHTLARSAAHLAEASQLLDDLAALDAMHYVKDERLDVTGLASLSDERARNLLRWWLSSHQQEMPSLVRLQEMLRQLVCARSDATIKIAVDKDIYLRRYRNMAYLELDSSESIEMAWQGESVINLPDNTRLLFEKKVGEGLAIQRLGIARLQIKHRQGGERFKPDVGRPTRTLKHLLQEAGMPPWQRARLPLIYHRDMLAVVPGIGVAAELQATENEPGLGITWQQSPV